MYLKELNSHPRDLNISFEEEPHIYYVNEEIYETSVTSFIHQFFEKFNAEEIIKKYYDIWQSNETSKYFGMTPEEIIQEWEDNRNLQAEKGTKLHESIEHFYNKIENNNEEKEFKHFLEFYKDHKHLKAFRTEWNIYDEELKLAGSIDMVFQEGENLHIYDWKRSKEIKENNPYREGKFPLRHLPDSNFWHYALQLNCYKAILEKYYDKNINELYLIILHPNNESYIKLKVPNLQKEINELFEIRKEELKNK